MSTHDRRACSAFLNLVAPPIANSMVSNIKNSDPRFIDILRESHFYMICGRAEAKFEKVKVSPLGDIDIEIALKSGLVSNGVLHIPKMKFIRTVIPDSSMNLKLKIKNDSDSLLIYHDGLLVFGTTPDELLMRRGRHESLVSGFSNYLEMMTFDLLYTGIAKENQNSYSRLIEKGHKARMDILAQEEQRSPGARVSDETYLLLFKIEPLTVTVFGAGDFDDEDFDFSIDYHRIIADAEKAIISTFKPKYNIQLYANYPKGKDGLYQQGYDGYSYSIAEGFAFNTAYGEIKGARDAKDILPSNEADFISVDGDMVTLNISGVDFNIPLDNIESE